MGFETFMEINGIYKPDESLFPKDEQGNLLNAYVTDVNDPRGIGYLSPGGSIGVSGETWHPSKYDFSGLNLSGSQDGKATFTDKNGLTFKYDYGTDSIENGIDPNTARDLLANSPTDYYRALATQLKNDYFDGWKIGHAGSLNELEAIKDVSPQAYYEAKLGLLGQQAGWYQGQNTTGGIAPLMDEVKALAPEAYKYGVVPEQINSLVNQGFTAANKENATRIANEASRGGAFLKPSDMITIASILGGGALAAYMAPAAAAAGAAEGAVGAGAAALGETAPLTTAELLGSSFSGSNFAIDPLATYAAGLATEAAPIVAPELANTSSFGLNPSSTSGIGLNAGSPSGIMATESAAGLGGSGTGIIEGLAPTSVGMQGTAGAGSLAGIAGSEAAAGLGGAALGTGLTADQLALYESQNPTSLQDVGKTLNQARQVNSAANSIAKLLSGGSTGTTGATSSAGGITASQLASLLSPKAQTNDFLGQYKMNQNPFTFTTQGQTTASPGMYDVSGSNMANALRKA